MEPPAAPDVPTIVDAPSSPAAKKTSRSDEALDSDTQGAAALLSFVQSEHALRAFDTVAMRAAQLDVEDLVNVLTGIGQDEPPLWVRYAHLSLMRIDSYIAHCNRRPIFLALRERCRLCLGVHASR